jgi:hypothetical protein
LCGVFSPNSSSKHRDKLLAKVDSADVKRSLGLLRGKANSITADNVKFVQAPAAIDFGAYKDRLKFTKEAVDKLEKVYGSRSIPQYSASLPAFEAKKRAAMLAVAKSTVDATKSDIDMLKSQLAAFEAGRITEETSVGELENRFPAIAKEIEEEIKNHEWQKDSM